MNHNVVLETRNTNWKRAFLARQQTNRTTHQNHLDRTMTSQSLIIHPEHNINIQSLSDDSIQRIHTWCDWEPRARKLANSLVDNSKLEYPYDNGIFTYLL